MNRPLLLLCAAPFAFAAPATTHLLQRPTMNRTHVVFTYAGDLWSVPRTGGTALRLTTGVGVENYAVFSPDGQTIAFSSDYDGNIDVFTIPATGGVPKRITHRTGPDYAVGWTPDGKRILFRSNRESFSSYVQLFTVDRDGGLAEALPLPMAATGAYSPDGSRMVYAPLDSGQIGRTADRWVAWRRYRGGRASYLWTVNLSDLSTEKVPRKDSNDINPMWIGNQIYFLSDRNGPMTLFRYDPATKAVTELIKNTGRDIRAASAAPGGIVYEHFGQLHIYDLASNKSTPVRVDIAADLSEVRPRLQNVSREIRSATVSPTGVRAVFEAHGEILSVPAEKGDIRNLTRTPGVMERSPAWSPDGRSIAYFSDESGEYALHIRPQDGSGEVKKIALAGKSAYYFRPRWSPDSKHIAFNDNQLNVWRVEVASGNAVRVDTDYYYSSELTRDIAWSPDSQWIAYVKSLPNRMSTVQLYSLATGQSTQVTDGMSDARYPAFDRDGTYLYFTASTNYGTTSSGLDMTSDAFEVTRNVYAAVLSNEAASPVAPESDEEKPSNGAATENRPAQGNATPKPVRIDLPGIGQRIVALPLPPRDYFELVAGKAGVIYLLEPNFVPGQNPAPGPLTKFDLKTRKTERLADNVGSFDISANGEKMLLRVVRPGQEGGNAPQVIIAPAGAPLKAGEGVLNIANMEVNVDPAAEWKQMFREVWRIERSYFYDANLHGLDAAAAEKEYEKYLETIASRDDLGYLFQEMLSDITAGHLRGGGGTQPQSRTVQGGLLGADFEIANGKYRFKRIYTGESWNPQLLAPLAQPGVRVQDGEYLLEINGQPLLPTDDAHRLLEGTANKRVVLRVGPDASGANARDITVMPVASEQLLRNYAWIEANRKKVDDLSGGKLAYVYMPDTGRNGLTSFNRYYFAQVDKQGVVFDERFNGGGQAADYVIDVLNRQLLAWWSPRYGAIYRTPAASILGPKVMIINETAGSGGDLMPWMFRYSKIGPLVGKRTWGGLIGVSQFPTLMDGGAVTAPNFGFFSPSGEWEVENHGVAPDIEVDQDPKAIKEGRDPQLERAIAVALDELKKNPPPEPKRPPYPNYNRPERGAGSPSALR